MFKHSDDLTPVYNKIVRTTIFTIKPDNIATFLGQRITYNCKKEVGTNYHHDVGSFRVKREVEHRNGNSTKQKAPLKKHLQSLPAIHNHECCKLPISGIYLVI